MVPTERERQEMIINLTKDQLVGALQRVQHFCPPRPTKQTKATLVAAVWAGINSPRYCAQMVAALGAVGLERPERYLPPKDDEGNDIWRR